MHNETPSYLSWDEFEKTEIRTGTILTAEIFAEARKPAYKLTIDFGPLGIKKTSAQLTALYKPEELPGKQVVAVVNFKPKQIANFMSECLVLGAVNNNEVSLLVTDKPVTNGERIA